MMTRRIQVSPRACWIALGLAVAAAGCVTEPRYNLNVSDRILDAASVAEARSFAILPSDLADNAAPPGEPDPVALADQAIRAALERELADLGWTAAPREGADVVVSYAIGGTEGVSEVTDAFLGRYSTVDPDLTRELPFVDQALIVDVADEATGESLWRGQAVARLFSPLGESRAAVIDQAVAEIIGRLDQHLEAG